MALDTSPIRIGYCLSLTGPLGSNGRTARLAHQIWAEDVNGRGGLLGRPVELICLDDGSKAEAVPDLYRSLLDAAGVDLVIGGYGDNSVVPAMPLIVERRRYFISLMALAANAGLHYENYFVMIPTGPQPAVALTQGFFDLAGQHGAKTVSILVADAPFSRAPVEGAKASIARLGLQTVSEDRYPLTTTDFAPFVQDLQAAGADVVFLCAYLNDSIGLIRAIRAAGLTPKLLGGAMIGPQNGMVKAELGPLLNGLVNYEYWLPAPALMFDGVGSLIERYQARALAAEADPLGYYVAPQAYAQLQVLEQAVLGTGVLDDEILAEWTRGATFDTVVGPVTFGEGGGWAEARVLQVQYRGVTRSDAEAFKAPGAQVVVAPTALANGALAWPGA